MSHLTRSPFHKPSPQDLEHALRPLSPPETTYEPVAPAPPSFDHADSAELPTPVPAPASEAHGSRFKKITYNNARDRTIQRNSRFLVVVLPPPMLLEEHGHLGHTLSFGPQHRLSSGILMSLFPTVRRNAEFDFVLHLPVIHRCMANSPRLLESSTSRP
jgi:hypothetical protein